jgi:hypothetical protein
MIEYESEYDNSVELIEKVPLETFMLFITAENYLNGAILQFKRINYVKEKSQEDLRYQELATLEVHSYLSYINLIYRCFESILRIHNKKDENHDKPLVKFWGKQVKILTPFRQARDFVEHINERIEHAEEIATDVKANAIYLTCFKDDALIYYPRKLAKDDRYKEASIPIDSTELDKIIEVYIEILSILKSRRLNPQYREENSKYTFMRNCVMDKCVGPMHALAPGSRNSRFEGCIVFPANMPGDPTQDPKNKY